MYTSDLSGKDISCVLPEVYWTNQISHQIWGRTKHEILVDAKWTPGKLGFSAVVLQDNEHPFKAVKLSDSHGMASHMVFSPDGTKLLADSYPDLDGMQTLALIDLEKGSVDILGKFNHTPEYEWIGDTRNDLHPRWSPDGKYVTVDSIHDNKYRACYLLEL